ncbi:MAG: restriction endonuclease subunit S [Acinetobacter sp.]
MVNDWNECKIDDLKAPVKGSIAMGPFGSRIKAENFVTAGIPIIKGGQLHGAYVLDSDFDFLTPEKAEELKSSQAYRGDLVITHRGTIGQVSIIPHDSLYEKYVVSQSQLKVSFDTNKINPYFVNYFFRTHLGQHRLLANASQVGVPAISKASTSVKAIMVPCPRLEEQNRVVDYLKVLDDKIELNRKMNETLEAMSQALFKSWFVDFDPVIDNALAAGNLIPDEFMERAEQRKTIKQNNSEENQAIRSLFPDEFEFTEEMGWIPKGWIVSDVGTEFNTVGGGTPSTKNAEFWEEGSISWTTPKDLSGNQSKILLHTERKITELGLNKISSGLLPIDTVLMSSRAPVGYLALAKVPVAINQGYIALKCEKILTPEFAIQWTDAIMDEIKQRAGGTTFAEITKRSFRTIPVIVPDKSIVSNYSDNVKGLYNQITSRLENIDTLSKLRDTLLPKLMSGEIRIPDAAAMVEGV